MGRIVSNFFISLDGVVESPDKWHFPYFNDEMGSAVGRGMVSAEAFLMGRVLYDEWSAYWPGRGEGVPGEPQETADAFASFINNVPKYVVSSTLEEATWSNTTLVSGDVAGRLREVRDRTEGDIAMSGSATLVRWLLANGLLDELALMIHPIAVGHGQRLFEDVPTQPLRLVREERFETGVLNVAYAPVAG
ncbi:MULTISPECIES: dihydrofolate reductase family protein [Thermomonosporaceae]|uniref:dihydrofolate reductase family protein n=1 Tax=Thermomonosporaceae TaxID=2012 RepID=UPI00255AB020|nr:MULTISPECIES: dihydrofolate reductase family protein [Thermomonosporaceae]MDL4773647.1 dihydrofolate reductase family protein [Actinomadura xylanilytica]